MRRFASYVPFVLTALLCACNAQQEQGCAPNPGKGDPATLDGYRLEGDSLVLPPFEVEVQLSDKARQELASAKETVVVVAYITGMLKPHIAEYPTKDGTIGFATSQVELAATRTARFRGLKVAKAAYCHLLAGDLELLINVTSGRKSTDVNLLDCETVQEKVGADAGKRYVVQGRLIGEK